MNRFILILSFLSPMVGNGQSIEGFKYDGSHVKYEHIYNVDTTSAGIQERLGIEINMIGGVRNISINGGLISGSVEDATVNYESYGYSVGTMMICMNYPMSYSFLIEIKDGKYRITISDVAFNTDLYGGISVHLTEAVYNKRKASFKSNSTAKRMLDALSLYFNETFSLKPLNDNW